MPAPNAYVPNLHWKPANNFQKQTTTKKVTMTAEIMKKTKQLGPGSHKVKYESRYHGQATRLVAPSRSPQLVMAEHYRAVSKETPGPTAYRKNHVS